MNIDNITSEGMSLSNDGKSMLISVYEKEIYNLQTRWDSLREWLNKGLEEPIYIQGDIFWCSACRDVLDKMNELERSWK